MANRLFVFGLGFSAMTLARELMGEGWSVAGTCRDADKRDRLAAGGVDARPFFADAPMADAADALSGATHLLLSIPPGEAGDRPLVRCLDEILALHGLRWIGYLSTTGVYGDAGGAWVDETSPLNATSVRATRRIMAEAQWLNAHREHGAPVEIFRLAGIYGPGRSALDRLRAGDARRIQKPGHCFGRVHVADIAGVVRASIRRPRPGSIYNVCDDLPAEPAEVVAYASELLNIDPPPLVAFDEASRDMSDMALTFWQENRKVRNDKAKRALGYAFRHPTYRDGLRAILSSGG